MVGCFEASSRREAARQATAEDVGVFHADARGAVAAHRVAHETAAGTIRHRPVVAVDVRHEIVRDEPFEVSRGDGTRVHRAVVHRLRVGQDDDDLLGAEGKGALDRLRYVNLLGPLFGADGIPVQRVEHRVAPRLLPRVARGQEHQDVAIDGIALQIAFQRGSEDLDAFDGNGFGARDRRRHLRLRLRSEAEPQANDHGQRDPRHQVLRRHLALSDARGLAPLFIG
jgi:hypothetical protein